LRIAAKISYKDDNKKVVAINESFAFNHSRIWSVWSLNRSLKVKEMATLKLSNKIWKEKEK
jgi:hypothetical protein